MIDSGTLAAQLRGMNQLPALRQFGLLIGLAAAVAIGTGAVLWSREPTYQVLYPDLSLSAQARAIDALRTAGIEHRLAGGTGALMVPAAEVHRARLQLASEGLPESGNEGYALLDGQDNGLGSSRRMETARFQRVLEGELARSIRSLSGVDTARVHLALPERSVFLRERTPPSASVVLKLFSGRSLDPQRIAGIRHLVAASVPELEVDNVAVLDQKGELLSPDRGDPGTGLSGRHLAMTRDLEQALVGRIQGILSPMLGVDGVRAEVTADIDYTQVETTSEVYDPDQRGRELVRSEHVVSESGGAGETGGVPGALSNSPPAAGTTELDEAVRVAAADAAETGRRDVTRNYELDRRVQHRKAVPGQVERISVAVVVDSARLQEAAGAGSGEGPAETAEVLSRIETLARQAVGFSAARGDTIRVSSVRFNRPDVVDSPMFEAPFWEDQRLWDMLRQILGVAVVIVLILTVLRPAMKSLAAPRVARLSLPEGELPAGLPGGGQGGAEAAPAASGQGQPDPAEQQLAQARQLVEQDPRRVAQLTRAWIGGGE